MNGLIGDNLEIQIVLISFFEEKGKLDLSDLKKMPYSQ